MVDYWYVTLFTLAELAVLWFAYAEPRLRPRRHRALYYLTETAVLLLTVYFVVIGIRGGFGRYTRPITISNAMQYVDRPTETALVLNTPFTLMKSLETETYVNPRYFPDADLDAIFSPEHQPFITAQSASHNLSARLCQSSVRKEQPAGHLKPHNVVVLILESFATEHIGFFNPDLDNGSYRGFTPCLDSILARSVTFRHSFASGRKSIDAMPSVLSSLPMLIEPYIVTPYATNAVSSLADVLGRQGYSTAFFHGAPNGSMGFQAYARSAAFERYYGMDEYLADPASDRHAYDGTWAIWDEEFLQFYCRTLTAMPEPFCTAVFTASSHHPFAVPERYEGLFPDGPQPLCRCIAYSDYALGRFFREAACQPWFEHTLFVLTADHTSQLYHDEYLNDRGLFSVPIAFYLPSSDRPELAPRLDSTQVVSQTDIMPSVLALTAPDQPFFAFGENALTASKRHNYAVCYQYPYYLIFSRNGLLRFDGDATVQTEGNLSPDEQADMLCYLKAYIQQYITRMTTNSLTLWKNE